MKLIRLSLKNLKEKTYRTLLASFSIAIGTASFIVFLGLSNGIQSATFEEIEKSNPLTQITVLPQAEKKGLISFLSSDNKLTSESLKIIKNIEGVEKVYSEIQFNNFASIEVKLLGFTLLTDTMVFGLDEKFIAEDIKSDLNWDTSEEPYPTVIPRKLLDMYNFTIASPQGLPLISEENLLGKELILYPAYSTFFPNLNKRDAEVKLEVVGFSDKVNLIGITLPKHVIDNLNEKFAANDSYKDSFIEIFALTSDPGSTSKVAGAIEEKGFKTQYYQKNLEDIEAKFKYLSLSLGAISLIILITASIAIISTFLATISERRREIGLLRAVGASKRHIKFIIFFEAGITGLIGSIIGIVIGIFGSRLIDFYGLKQLEGTTFTPESLFYIDTKLIISTLIFGLVLTILSAYIPARKAANLHPISAIKGK
ncbi:FtsX-like permease family protein [Candidatus Peregrinibacteria bacterium]|nr:FtsX-like permease family protein [Candidatus Peregrinibacteria bacterium]